MISYIVWSIGYLRVDVRVASGDREAQPNGTLGNRTLGDVTKTRL
ncbi:MULTISPECIES: hypothetical protein [unclassified Anabaena]